MNAPAPTSTLMSGDDFRESLRRYKPRVFLDGQQVASVADERGFGPGINAIALTYDYALKPKYAPIMTAVQHTSGKLVNRLSHINTSSGDLLNKLEAVRLVCQETGCAQRYLTHDAMNAIGQVSARIDDARKTFKHPLRDIRLTQVWLRCRRPRGSAPDTVASTAWERPAARLTGKIGRSHEDARVAVT